MLIFCFSNYSFLQKWHFFFFFPDSGNSISLSLSGALMSSSIFPSPPEETQTKCAWSWLSSKLPWTSVFLAGMADGRVILQCQGLVGSAYSAVPHYNYGNASSRALAICTLTDTVTTSYPTNVLWYSCSFLVPPLCFSLLVKMLIADS